MNYGSINLATDINTPANPSVTAAISPSTPDSWSISFHDKNSHALVGKYTNQYTIMNTKYRLIKLFYLLVSALEIAIHIKIISIGKYIQKGITKKTSRADPRFVNHPFRSAIPNSWFAIP